MARYTGPRTRIARKFKEPIYGSDKYFERKNYPPGQHGLNRKRAKLSEYGIQLQEKQKAKYTYGILERQFRKLFHIAARKKGITGQNLMKLIESRLDNIVFRLGIAPTRAAARQFMITPLMLCRKYVVGMKERGCGYILNISSLASWMIWPGIGMYGSTKRFVKDY